MTRPSQYCKGCWNCHHLRGQNLWVRIVGPVKALWCHWFHKKDHVCWDDLWAGNNDAPLPGKCVWYCNRCGRSWATVNPRVFATDCADNHGVLPEKYYRKYPPEIWIRKCKCMKKPQGEMKDA